MYFRKHDYSTDYHLFLISLYEFVIEYIA